MIFRCFHVFDENPPRDEFCEDSPCRVFFSRLKREFFQIFPSDGKISRSSREKIRKFVEKSSKFKREIVREAWNIEKIRLRRAKDQFLGAFLDENQQIWTKIAPEGREFFGRWKNSRFTKTNKKTLIDSIAVISIASQRAENCAWAGSCVQIGIFSMLPVRDLRTPDSSGRIAEATRFHNSYTTTGSHTDFSKRFAFKRHCLGKNWLKQSPSKKANTNSKKICPRRSYLEVRYSQLSGYLQWFFVVRMRREKLEISVIGLKMWLFSVAKTNFEENLFKTN